MQEPVNMTKGRTRQRLGRISLRIIVLLFLCFFSGCIAVNRFIFIPKTDIGATPAKYGIDYQEIWFQARDGVQLNGWFVPGDNDKPLVLFFHGNAGNLSDNLEYLNMLHGDRFPVFIFDYRGFGKSEGEPLHEEDLYQDARGALSYLAGQGRPPGGMIFFGQSLGSAVALQMALETKPAGLVMESSFTSMEEAVKSIAPVAYYTFGWWSLTMHFDNLAKISRLQVPLLLIHGDRDGVLPVRMTRQLYARAVAPKMLLVIRGGGHCDSFKADGTAYLAAWSNYLNLMSARTVIQLGSSR